MKGHIFVFLCCCAGSVFAAPAAYNPCATAGQLGCQIDCAYNGFPTGYCNDKRECVCTRPSLYNEAKDNDKPEDIKKPCETGSLLGCQIHCNILGYLYGHCDADNVCKCGSLYNEASQTKSLYNEAREDRNPCESGSLLGCQIHCNIKGYLYGHCDENNECKCGSLYNEAKQNTKTLYNEAREDRNPCESGSLLGCQIHCNIKGYLYGHCDENNECKCGSLYKEAKQNTKSLYNEAREDRNPCESGSLLGCQIHCNIKGYLYGHCDENNECKCGSLYKEAKQNTKTLYNEAREDRNPCESGSLLGCQIHCNIKGYLYGHCDENNECKCGSLYKEAKQNTKTLYNEAREDRNPCESGSLLGCQIHCNIKGYLYGHCDENNECKCGSLYKEAKQNTKTLYNEAREDRNPCESGSLLGCQIHCNLNGYLYGHCNENNECKCGSLYKDAKVNNPCESGGILACEMECLIAGKLSGYCDENKSCVCT